MAVFGVEIERDPQAIKFIGETNQRIQLKGNIGKNPFFGRAYILGKPKKWYGIFNMEPVYPRAYFGGLFILIPALLLSKFTWTPWYIPGVALLGLGFFWSKYFFYSMFKLGIRRAKYQGKLRLIKTKELLQILTM